MQTNSKLPRCSSFPLALVLAGGLAAPALAQQPKVTSAPELDKSPPSFNLTLGGRGEYQFEADLDKGAGKVSVGRAGADLGLSFKVGDRSRLNVKWDSEFSWYDWKDASAFSKGSKDPWEDTQQHALAVQLVVPENDTWAWFVGGGAQASYERGADFGDSMTYGGQGGVRYAFSKDFALSLGVGVRTRLEEDAWVLPIIGIDWNINEKLTLSTERGTGLKLNYKAADNLDLWLQGMYDSREFRLSDDGAAKDGVGADRRVPVSIGVDWKVASSATITFQGGVIAWSTYKLSDDQGVKISQTDADPAAFLGLGIEFKF